MEQEPTSVLNALAQSEQGRPKTIVFTLSPEAKPALVFEAADAYVEPMPDAAIPRAHGSEAPTTPQSVFVEQLASPPSLTIFGAGEDAVPLVEFASRLGWRLAVADGRANLLQGGRFPSEVVRRQLRFPPASKEYTCVSCGPSHGSHTVETGVQAGEMAVVLTHSFEQDRAILQSLLPLDLLYLGILGPRHRTTRLLQEIAPVLGWSVEHCFTRLRSPVGIDLGGRDPAAIALSIVVDLQAASTGRRLTVNREALPAPPACAAS